MVSSAVFSFSKRKDLLMKIYRDFLVWSLIACILCLAGAAIASDGAAFDPGAKLKVQNQVLNLTEKQKLEAALSWRNYSESVKKITASKGKSLNAFDVTYTLVTMDADEAAGTIDAVVAVTIKALEDGLSEAVFVWMPFGDYHVENDLGATLATTIDGFYDTATVTLPTTLNTGEQQVLKFFVSGAPNCAPDPYFQMVLCQVSEEIVFDASPYWIPTKAANTYEEMYTTGAVDLDITTPLDYVAVTTSDLDNVENLGDKLVHYFKGHFSSQFVAYAYSKFDVFSTTTSDNKPVQALIHTGVRDYGQKWSQICADIINYFSQVYSPYEYNKQDVVQAIEELGGGVGPESATFYYASALNTDPQTTFSESIFSHEIGHSWWANMIRLGDVNSPWLDEGFAEYSSRLYGYQVWPQYYQDYLYEYYFYDFKYYVDPKNEVPLTSKNILTADSEVYFMITYLKGSHVLRMLQWLLGDDAFFAGMAAYSDANIWDSTHHAVTVDTFRAAMEAASSQNLEEFFNTWVFSAGYPVYQWAAEFSQTETGYSVKVKIDQVQASDTIYDLPIEVSIKVKDEDDLRYFSVDFTGKTAEQTFGLDKEPRGIKVDGSWWIWGDKVPVLAGDVDGSNEVDGLDLIYTAFAQGSNILDYDKAYNYLPEADINRDGKVDENDLNLLLNNFAKKGAINE